MTVSRSFLGADDPRSMARFGEGFSPGFTHRAVLFDLAGHCRRMPTLDHPLAASAGTTVPTICTTTAFAPRFIDQRHRGFQDEIQPKILESRTRRPRFPDHLPGGGDRPQVANRLPAAGPESRAGAATDRAGLGPV